MVKAFSNSKGNLYFKFFIAFVFILIAVLLVFPYFNNKDKKDILNLDLELGNENLNDNQSLKFMTKLDYNKKCDGLLQYEIFRLNNITLSINKTENIMLNGKISRNNTLKLNKLPPDNYILRAKIRCDDNLGFSTARFKISAKETDAENMSDKIPLKQNISDGKPTEDVQINKNTELRTTEIIATSSHDPAKAQQMCNSLNAEKKDECLSGIAERTKNKDFCSKIQSISARDGCYLSLVLEGIQIDCADVYDSYQRGACYSLKTNQG